MLFLGAFISHYLTQRRERTKADGDWHQKWMADVKALIAKISDNAILHYIDDSSVQKTATSAALIISDIKRLGAVIDEASCCVPSDSKATSDSLRAFNAAITDPEDFQDIRRSARLGNDEVCARIRACEQALLSAIKKPRRKKV